MHNPTHNPRHNPFNETVKKPLPKQLIVLADQLNLNLRMKYYLIYKNSNNQTRKK